MPTLKISLKHNDDVHVDDTWRLYYAFIGRLYQSKIESSEFGIRMMQIFKRYGKEWSIGIAEDEVPYIEYVVLKCNVFTSIFNVELLPWP